MTNIKYEKLNFKIKKAIKKKEDILLTKVETNLTLQTVCPRNTNYNYEYR